jgi:hypothetical protein
MNLNQFKTPTAIQRLCSLIAAIAVTVTLGGIQLGIANGYTAQADALLAAKHLEATSQQTAAAASRGPRS